MTLAASSSTRGDVASAPAPPRPCDVGIIAMEVYFPRTFVSQVELERFDGVSAGKYTIGLGQDQMAVVSDREGTLTVRFARDPAAVAHKTPSVRRNDRSVVSSERHLFSVRFLPNSSSAPLIDVLCSLSRATTASFSTHLCVFCLFSLFPSFLSFLSQTFIQCVLPSRNSFWIVTRSTLAQLVDWKWALRPFLTRAKV